MKSIGGFFELETVHLKPNGHFHKNATYLNSGRACLEFLIRSKQYRRAYIPYYICDSVVDILKKLTVEIIYYNIDSSFRPQFVETFRKDTCILYVNYFGICDAIVDELANRYRNLIVDNTQSFYSLPKPGVDTFYSARKFFGVSDGGVLYTSSKLNYEMKQDESWDRQIYLVQRLEKGPEFGYNAFLENENKIGKAELRKMSVLTSKMLSAIDYDSCKKIRIQNFNYIHRKLKDYNKLGINADDHTAKMVYPLLLEENIRPQLIQNRVYIATYWSEVLQRNNINAFEKKLASKLIPIPIDQRYGLREMDFIIDLIKEFTNEKV